MPYDDEPKRRLRRNGSPLTLVAVGFAADAASLPAVDDGLLRGFLPMPWLRGHHVSKPR